MSQRAAAMNDGPTANRAPEYAYHMLRSAHTKFSKRVSDLNGEELRIACKVADKTYALESRVLSSDEARAVVIGSEMIDEAVNELVSRYENYDSFVDHLTANGIDESVLRKALHRELMFDAVMRKVASRAANISDIDVDLFYHFHIDRFTTPEVRHASHILVTVNPAYTENTRENARRRADHIRQQLAGTPSLFPELVLKHSECPSALEGGKLGAVTRGKLYQELEQVLFAMREGQFSPVIETEVGYHILFCERIEASKTIPLKEARERIRPLLEHRQRRNCQKAWLAKLEEGLS